MRLRLRSVSRTGRLPGRLSSVTKDVLEARNARVQLSLVHPTLAHHLGELDRGPLTDVDEVLAALRAVRRLQSALGPRLDEARDRKSVVSGTSVSGRVDLGCRRILKTKKHNI